MASHRLNIAGHQLVQVFKLLSSDIKRAAQFEMPSMIPRLLGLLDVKMSVDPLIHLQCKAQMCRSLTTRPHHHGSNLLVLEQLRGFKHANILEHRMLDRSVDKGLLNCPLLGLLLHLLNAVLIRLIHAVILFPVQRCLRGELTVCARQVNVIVRPLLVDASLQDSRIDHIVHLHHLLNVKRILRVVIRQILLVDEPSQPGLQSHNDSLVLDHPHRHLNNLAILQRVVSLASQERELLVCR
mmetsp:Transcript_2524/g.2795  ORF Transcript_2524/g.2795 Transcript_2524/m.2795 type:complete len:240 (+) Transcript_2524:527-1246(+)